MFTGYLARKDAFVIAFLLLLVLTVFGPTVRNDFIGYDDGEYVTGNAVVGEGLTAAGAKWAFTSFHAQNWHPLTWLSHMADVEFFGLDPGGHHAVNVLFHAAAAMVLFLTLRLMTGALWPSALAAALFAVHPLHVESVAWIAERKDVLSTFLWMLTMSAYWFYVQRRSAGRYLLTAALFTLGLMAKPMLVSLPLALILLDFWPLGRVGKLRDLLHLTWEKAPLILLSAASSWVTYAAQSAGGAVVSLEHLSPAERAANACVAYVAYIGKTFRPGGLALHYPHPGHSLASATVLFSAFLIAAATILALWITRRRPYVATGWFWYLGTLVPVIGILQVGNQALADRYTYVPLTGLFVIISWSLADIVRAKGRWKVPLGTAAVTAVLLCALGSRLQVSVWKDSVTLFSHALAVTSDNWTMHNNLGSALARRGDLEGAVVHFGEAVRLKPSIARYRFNLGNALAGRGSLSQAEAEYREAMKLRPDHGETRNNLGALLYRLGRKAEGLALFAETLRLDPESEKAHFNMAAILHSEGRIEEAVLHYEEALRLDPGLEAARSGLEEIRAAEGERAAFPLP